MNTIISTIHKGNTVIQAIKLCKPTKACFIIDPQNKIAKHSIEMIKDFFPKLLIEQHYVKDYDIVDIAHTTINIIEKKESKEKIIIHISEGQKTISLGVLFGAYCLNEKITSIYYIVEETNQPINIPLVNINVSSKKREILQTINREGNAIPNLEKKLKITSATLYVHLKELRDWGCLDKNNNLTEMGKIVIIRKETHTSNWKKLKNKVN